MVNKTKPPAEPMALQAFARERKAHCDGLALHVSMAPEKDLAEEIQVWVQNLEAWDPDLQRTHEGVFHLAGRDAKCLRIAEAWARAVVDEVLRPSIPREAQGHTGRLWHLMHCFQDRPMAEASSLRLGSPRGKHALALALLVFAGIHDPTPLGLRDILNAYLNAGLKSRLQVRTSLELVKKLFGPKPHAADLDLLAMLVDPWEKALDAAKPESERMEREVLKAEARIAILEDHLREARESTRAALEQCRSWEQTCREKDAEIGVLHGQINDRMREHDRFHGEVESFLAWGVAKPLETTLDAVTAEDPGLVTAAKLLKSTLEDIRTFRTRL